MSALHAEVYKYPDITATTGAPIIAAPELSDDILRTGAAADMQSYRERPTDAPTLQDLAKLLESGAPAEIIDSLGALCIRNMRTGEKDDMDVEELRDVAVPTKHWVDLSLARQRLSLARTSLWREISGIAG